MFVYKNAFTIMVLNIGIFCLFNIQSLKTQILVFLFPFFSTIIWGIRIPLYFMGCFLCVKPSFIFLWIPKCMQVIFVFSWNNLLYLSTGMCNFLTFNIFDSLNILSSYKERGLCNITILFTFLSHLNHSGSLLLSLFIRRLSVVKF